MKRRGWIERAREPRLAEGRILVTLRHPRIRRSGKGLGPPPYRRRDVPQLPLDAPGPRQLNLFEEER